MTAMQPSCRAVFLDRDGVINRMIYHAEFGLIDSPQNPDEFELLPGVGEAIHRLNQMGWLAVVVSNQPGIAKSKSTRALLEATTHIMHRDLALAGAHLDAVYYCLHHPEAVQQEYKVICDCRKPKPGLLQQAAVEHSIDLRASFMVGDGLTDVLAGQAAGCVTVLLGNDKCEICQAMQARQARPDFVFSDLVEAVRFIEKNSLETRPVVF